MTLRGSTSRSTRDAQPPTPRSIAPWRGSPGGQLLRLSLFPVGVLPRQGRERVAASWPRSVSVTSTSSTSPETARRPRRPDARRAGAFARHVRCRPHLFSLRALRRRDGLRSGFGHVRPPMAHPLPPGRRPRRLLAFPHRGPLPRELRRRRVRDRARPLTTIRSTAARSPPEPSMSLTVAPSCRLADAASRPSPETMTS